jgi:vacuolar-type H+-ATPase subunit H
MITVPKNLPAPTGNNQLQHLEEDSERANFRRELLQDSNQDLSTFGMRVVSVSLQNIWDTSNYIGNLASKTLAGKRQEVEVQEARLRARAEQAESDRKRREIVAVNQANERILASQQELEILRRQCQAAIEQASLEADSAIAKASNEAELAINQITNELQKLRNVSQVTLRPDAERQAAEILAAGESESVKLLQELQNNLLIQKVQLVTQGGEVAKVALFMNQNLEKIFTSYQQYAQNLKVDNYVMMDETRGFNGVVNRGPEAMVDFLAQFEKAFGVSVRDMMTVDKDKKRQ